MVLVMLYGGLRVSEVCNLDREDIDFKEFTMLYGGLRVSEVCNLDREDIDFKEFTITVKNTKNRIDRTVAVTEKCIRAIERYLETRDDMEKPLLMSLNKRRISRNLVDRCFIFGIEFFKFLNKIMWD